jgi:hypothetical protein
MSPVHAKDEGLPHIVNSRNAPNAGLAATQMDWLYTMEHDLI